jgi:hypothetical protein
MNKPYELLSDWSTMKICIISNLFLTILILTISCGQIGKIKSYEYDMTKFKLAAIISDYYKAHPELNKGADTNIYTMNSPGYEQDYFNCYIQTGDDTCMFVFSYLGDSTYWANDKHSEIGLRYACKYGQLLKINSDLGFFEKRKFIKIFEKGFIDKLPIKPVDTD